MLDQFMMDRVLDLVSNNLELRAMLSRDEIRSCAERFLESEDPEEYLLQALTVHTILTLHSSMVNYIRDNAPKEDQDKFCEILNRNAWAFCTRLMADNFNLPLTGTILGGEILAEAKSAVRAGCTKPSSN